MAGSFLRQSTASQSRATPPFLDDTDFKTAETGLTIANTDVKIIVNGGASADKNSGGGTHRANGVYGLTFDATDTATVGEMEVSIKVAGALPVFMKFWVLEEAVYDALFAASAAGYQVPIWAAANSTVNLSATTIKTATDVETDTADIQSRLPAALTGDGNIKADTLRVGGTSQTPGDVVALINTVDDFIDTEVAAIKAKTDNLPSDPADASDIASSFSTVNSTLATVAGYLDTEIAAIKAKTDQLTFGTANRVNAQVYGFENDSITNAAFDNATGKQVIRSGTLQAGAGYSATLDASASSTDDTYIGTWIYLTAGTGAGQCRMISAYNGTTKVATIIGKSWATTPDNTTEYSILPAAYVYGAKEIYNDGIFPGSIAADAITASALATDAVTEIQSGLATAADLATIDDFLDTEIAAIKAKTDNLPSDPADASDIAAAIADLPTNSELTAALATADDAVLAAIAALNNLSAAQVNAEVVDALATDTYAEPGQGAPSATTSLAAKLNYLYKWMRNKKDNTGSENRFYADNGTTVDQKQTTAESGGTVTVGEMTTGA